MGTIELQVHDISELLSAQCSNEKAIDRAYQINKVLQNAIWDSLCITDIHVL